MIIKVYKNPILVDIQDDFAKAKEYFARHNVPIDFEFVDTNIKGYKVVEENFGSAGFRYQITGHQNQLPLSKEFISVFAFNGNDFPFNKLPTSKCESLPQGVLVTLMTYKEGDVVGETYITLIHELMHALIFYLRGKGAVLEDPMDVMLKNGTWVYYYNNHLPDSVDSNFGEAWKRITPHLSFLNNTSYKWFSYAEVAKWKLKPALWELLDKMREKAGTPFVITSGLRTPQENADVGGVPNSAHLKGLAVDLLCVDNRKRSMMLGGVMPFREGIFLEIARRHLHISIENRLGDAIVADDD